jgi:hypothetical protein
MEEGLEKGPAGLAGLVPRQSREDARTACWRFGTSLASRASCAGSGASRSCQGSGRMGERITIELLSNYYRMTTE